MGARIGTRFLSHYECRFGRRNSRLKGADAAFDYVCQARFEQLASLQVRRPSIGDELSVSLLVTRQPRWIEAVWKRDRRSRLH